MDNIPDNCPVDINPGQENNDGDQQGDICDPDDDNDDVTDVEEITEGTDPFVFADTDEDGMSDDWESIRGTNSAVDDALLDLDNDGFINILELIKGTLPQDVNSVPIVNTVYVDIGNSSGVEDGSQANPFSSIPVGVAAAEAGDTLEIAPGNYPLSFYTITKPIRFIGSGVWVDNSVAHLFCS